MLIQDDAIEGMKILYRDLRGTENFTAIQDVMSKFLE